MDINGWSFWAVNTERIMESEGKYDRINIRGLNRKELLEYLDLENQHDEQKIQDAEKNKKFRGITLTEKLNKGSSNRLFKRADSFMKG